MLPALADLDDLAPRLPGGVISEGDEARAQAALDDASARIRSVAGKTWIDPDTEDSTDPQLVDDVPDIIITICCAAARRSLVNPDGLTGESTGSYSYSAAHASPDVYLTRSEQRDVRKAAGRGPLGVIPTTRGPSETTTLVPVEGQPEAPLPADVPSHVT